MTKRIIFGYDDPDYTTTTGSCMAATKDSIARFGAKHFTEQVNPDNKTVHWDFGTEKAPYSTSNGLPDPRLSGFPPVEINHGDNLKKANFILGYDAPSYTRSNKGPSFDEMAHHTERFIEENKSVKRAQKSNITWGYETGPVQTQTQTSFVDHEISDISRKEEKRRIKTFVDTLKTSAVSFGIDQLSYSTSNRFPGHDVRERPPPSLLSSKQAQQKTNIIFGYD